MYFYNTEVWYVIHKRLFKTSGTDSDGVNSLHPTFPSDYN